MPSLKRKNIAKKRARKFIKRRKPLYKRKIFWIFLLVFCFIGFSVWALLFSPWFQVKKIEIHGLETLEKKEVLSECYNLLFQKILFFKTKSIFTVSLSKFQNHLLNQFPKIKQIKIRRRLPDALIISIEERSPTFNFLGCDKSYLMDDQGIIFEEGEEEELITIQKSKINDCNLGEKVLSEEQLQKIFLFTSHFYPKAEVKEIYVYPLKLELLTNQEWKAIFSFEKDPNKQLKELTTVIEKKILPENLNRLEYIDLRFSAISYKFKQ